MVANLHANIVAALMMYGNLPVQDYALVAKLSNVSLKLMKNLMSY